MDTSRNTRLAPDVYKAMLGVHEFLGRCGLEESLLNLVYLRASQINGCGYCIDMHWKALRADGTTEEKLYMLTAWRQSPDYSDRERAAMEWTEAVTRLHDSGVPHEVRERAGTHFNEHELDRLTLAVCAINSWNRLNLALQTRPVVAPRAMA